MILSITLGLICKLLKNINNIILKKMVGNLHPHTLTQQNFKTLQPKNLIFSMLAYFNPNKRNIKKRKEPHPRVKVISLPRSSRTVQLKHVCVDILYFRNNIEHSNKITFGKTSLLISVFSVQRRLLFIL